MEEPKFEAGLDRPRLERTTETSGVTVLVPVLPAGTDGVAAIAAQRDMLDAVLAEAPAGRRLFWYYTPMALEFSRHVVPDLLVYDCMDELSAFRGASPALVTLEAELFGRADVVFTGGRSLYNAKKSRHPNVHLFPSSIDKAHFARARDGRSAEPADQAPIGGPRCGYFGVIDERMDLELVDAVAGLRPDMQLVMIGPVVKIDPQSLPRRPNLHWLGQKSYQDLPAYLSGWQAAFMPFALNESTRFISPTKTPEFLSAGIPVVSTPVADVVEPYGVAGLVEIADTPEAFAEALDRAVNLERAPWLGRVDRHLAGQSWDLTWSQMLALIEDRAAAKAGRAVPETTRAGSQADRPVSRNELERPAAFEEIVENSRQRGIAHV
jgi:glycosyltransferase involved in cell wall biosynthesis